MDLLDGSIKHMGYIKNEVILGISNYFFGLGVNVGFLDHKEYLIVYYKTDLKLKEFSERIDLYLSQNESYECEKNIHSSGLSFKRNRKGFTHFLTANMAILFSQRSDYSLISIQYYSPTIVRYLNLILFIILSALAIVAPPFLEEYNLAGMVSGNIIGVSLLAGLISFALYKLESRDINLVLDKVMDSFDKIKPSEYQKLLGDDEPDVCELANQGKRGESQNHVTIKKYKYKRKV